MMSNESPEAHVASVEAGHPLRWRSLHFLCCALLTVLRSDIGERVITGRFSGNRRRHGRKAQAPCLEIITSNKHQLSISYHDNMAKTLVGALALAALPSALAFRNTSPFVLFSTAE
jgi:hypothetical protein